MTFYRTIVRLMRSRDLLYPSSGGEDGACERVFAGRAGPAEAAVVIIA
jgi:hypothetical protein